MPRKWKVFDRLVIFLPCQPLSGRGRDHMMVGQRKWSKNIYLRKTTGKDKNKTNIVNTADPIFFKRDQCHKRGAIITMHTYNDFCLVKIQSYAVLFLKTFLLNNIICHFHGRKLTSPQPPKKVPSFTILRTDRHKEIFWILCFPKEY